LRFVLGQLVPHSRHGLDRLLEPGDLPGDGWSRLDQRTWRTGIGNPAPWAQRARAAGSVTAWRSFVAGERTLWVQVVPFASAGDAGEALPALFDHQLANLRSQAQLVEEHDVAVPAALQAEAVMRVQRTDLGRTVMLAFVRGDDLVVLAASAPGEGWNVDDVTGLAALQGEHLVRTR
jgi:hypothetical protein